MTSSMYIQTHGPRPKWLYCASQSNLTMDLAGKESEVITNFLEFS